MPESRQKSLLASIVAMTQAALAALSLAKAGDVGATRRALRSIALKLAEAARLAGEAELAAVIERSLYVSSGLVR